MNEEQTPPNAGMGHDGVKQLNIVVPFALRKPLQKIAAECRNGQPIGMTLFMHSLSVDTPALTENKKMMLWKIVNACRNDTPLDKVLYALFLKLTTPETRASHGLREKLEKNKHLHDLGHRIQQLPSWKRWIVMFLAS